jgi:hypothetical protein
MSDEVQKIRKRMQELRELHFTGFVDDAQFAEAKSLLERKLVAAVIQHAQEAAEAQFAPTQLLDPSTLPTAMLPARRQARASTRWRLWLLVGALLVPLIAALAWWGASHGLG